MRSITSLFFLSAVVLSCVTAYAQCGNCDCARGAKAAPTTAPATQPAAALTDQEKTTLLRMREEEKLAHDVYVTLSRKYDLRPLQNIPRSERQHQSAVASLLGKYGVADPVAELPEGKFASETFQKLYDQLVADGQASEVAALKVGCLIEELDIKDLREAIAATDKEDLKQVYSNLEEGSKHHLSAFAGNLRARGATYAAQHLEQAEFDKLASVAPGGHGRGRRAGNGS